MIKIRLLRSGVRNNPYYRIVAIEDKKGPKGQYLEIVGTWQPSKKILTLDKKILSKWTKVGAKISPAVEKIIKENKLELQPEKEETTKK